MDGQSSPPSRSEPLTLLPPPPASELTSTSPKRSLREMVALRGGGAKASRASHDGSVPRVGPGLGPRAGLSSELLRRSPLPPLASCSSRFAAAASSLASASFRASSAALCSRLLASLSACLARAAAAILSSSFRLFSASFAILSSFSRFACSAACALAALAAGPNLGAWSPACATAAALRRFFPSSLTTWIGCDLRMRPGHGLS